MLIAQRHLPAGGKTRFTFKEYTHTFQVLQCLEAERGVIRDYHCEEHGQVTIIYPQISLIIVPDECVWKLKAIAQNGGLTA